MAAPAAPAAPADAFDSLLSGQTVPVDPQTYSQFTPERLEAYQAMRAYHTTGQLPEKFQIPPGPDEDLNTQFQKAGKIGVVMMGLGDNEYLQSMNDPRIIYARQSVADAKQKREAEQLRRVQSLAQEMPIDPSSFQPKAPPANLLSESVYSATRGAASAVNRLGGNWIGMGAGISEFASHKAGDEKSAEYFRKAGDMARELGGTVDRNFPPAVNAAENPYGLTGIAGAVGEVAPHVAAGFLLGPAAPIVTAAVQGGGDSHAQILELARNAKDEKGQRLFSDDQAQSMALRGAAVNGAVQAALARLSPLQRILRNNPAARPILMRMALTGIEGAAAGTGGAAMQELMPYLEGAKAGTPEEIHASVEALKLAAFYSWSTGSLMGALPHGVNEKPEPRPELQPETGRFNLPRKPAGPDAPNPDMPPVIADEVLPNPDIPPDRRIGADEDAALLELIKTTVKNPDEPTKPPVTADAPPTITPVTEPKIPPRVGDVEEPHIVSARKIIPDLRPLEPKTTEQKEAVEAGKVLGLKVQFYGSNTPEGKESAFALPEDRTHLFIHTRVRGKNPVREAFAHEAAHALQQSDPETVDRIIRAIDPKELGDRAKDYYQRYTDKFGNEAATRNLSGDDARLREEAVALIIGEAASKDRIWRTIAGKDPTLIESIKDAAGGVLDRIWGRSKALDEIGAAFESRLKDVMNPKPERQPLLGPKEFERPSIRRRLWDAANKENGLEEQQAIDEALLEETGAMGAPFTFKGKLPEEVRTFLEGAPSKLKRMFKIAKAGEVAGGEDAMSALEDRYWDVAERQAGVQYKTGLKYAKKSQNADTRMLAELHDISPLAKDKRKLATIEADKLTPGSTLEYNGVKLSVEAGEGRARILKGLGEDFNLDEINEVPYDAGTIRRSAAKETPKAAIDDVPFLPGAKQVGRIAKRLIEDDIVPAVKEVGDAFKEAGSQIVSTLAPQTRGDTARYVANSVREMNAEGARRKSVAYHAMKAARRMFQRMAQAPKWDMIERLEKGTPQTNGSLAAIDKVFRDLLNGRWTEANSLPTGRLVAFIKDYFPHQWKDKVKAAEFYSKMPLQGSRSFLKQRFYQLFSEGVNVGGLEPLYDNPVDMVMAKIVEMDKYILSQRLLTDLKAKGVLQKITARDKLPTGFIKLNDPIGTIYGKPNRRGSRLIKGYWVAEAASGNVINNHLSPGLRHRSKLLKVYMGVGNVLNAVQLGLSGFHAVNTGIDAMVGELGMAIKLAADGKPVESIKSALSVPIAPFMRIKQGRGMMKEWLRPGTQGAAIAKIIDAEIAGGGRAEFDPTYHNEAVEKMADAWFKGNWAGAALRAPFAAVEMASAPIMEHMVPLMKQGTIYRLASYELEKIGPTASRAEVREVMRKVVDHVDNVLGEMVYDNLFWNKTAKDIAMATTRAVGWNLGTVRTAYQGIKDIGSVTGRGLLKGKVDISHPTSYLLALVTMTAGVGAVMHRLMTGKNPEDLKDYFYPKTGEKDDSGHDVRLALPTYMKDYIAIARHPGRTAANKAHPLINMTVSMLQNEDYYGTKIYNEDDPLMVKLLDGAKFAGKQFEPLGVREFRKLRDEGSSMGRSIAPLVGITMAPKEMSQSKAERRAHELGNFDYGPRTTEQADRADLRKKIGGKLRKGEDARDEVKANIAGGKMTVDDWKRAARGSREGNLTRAVHSLNLDDTMKVWDEASDAEKREILPLVARRIQESTSVPVERRRAYLDRLRTERDRLRK